MAVFYILYSKNLDSYYIGSCKNFKLRLDEHNSGKYIRSFTKRTNDWGLYFSFDKLEYTEARNIESHVKRMKSKKYIKNLKRYIDLQIKLKSKYCTGSFR